MSDNVTRNTRDLVHYILRDSDLLRSPVFLFVFIASATRTALIYLINETAERGGATLWMFSALIAVTIVMLLSTHWAKMAGVNLVQRLALKMRASISDRILKADVGFFQGQNQGTVFHASTTHVNNVAGTALRLVEIAQAGLLLIFVFGYMMWQMPASVVAAFIAMAFGVAAFFATEGPATRAYKVSHQAAVAFNDLVADLLKGYKELRLRQARRTEISDRIETQINEARRLTMVSERYYSFGQIGASGSLALLLISSLSCCHGLPGPTA